MGILSDYLPDLLPDDPNKNAAARQGLLAFAGSMLNSRGSLLGGVGNGIVAGGNGYQGAMAQQGQQALRDAQLKNVSLENQRLQAGFDKPGILAKIAAGIQSPGAISSGAPGSVQPVSSLPQIGQQRQPAPAPMGGANFDMGYGNDSPNSMPTMPQQAAPQQQAAPTQQPSGADAYQAQVLYAQALATNGYLDDAKEAMAVAKSMRPNVRDTRAQTTADGKRVMVNYFDDGSHAVVDGVLPDAEKVAFQNTGGATLALDPFTGKAVNTIKNTQTPDSVASNAITIRGQNMTDARARDDAAANEQAPITDQAILNAAARYNLDGTLPPMGMGKSAAAGRSAILNKAAELKIGVDPEQQRRDQLQFKGDNASQTAAVKAFASGKQGNSVRSFNVSLSHLDTLDQLADALHNGDTQGLNKVSNYVAAQTGSAAPTNFDAAKKVVADEVVKAIVGSGGGVHDREEAAKVIASANSPAQLKGVIGTYKELMRGQLHGLQQQYEVSTGRNDFDRFLSDSAKNTTRATVMPLKDVPKKAAAPAAAYTDADKEARYQAWKRSQK